MGEWGESIDLKKMLVFFWGEGGGWARKSLLVRVIVRFFGLVRMWGGVKLQLADVAKTKWVGIKIKLCW